MNALIRDAVGRQQQLHPASILRLLIVARRPFGRRLDAGRGALSGRLHERYRFGTALSPLREREQQQRGGHSCNDGT